MGTTRKTRGGTLGGEQANPLEGEGIRRFTRLAQERHDPVKRKRQRKYGISNACQVVQLMGPHRGARLSRHGT